MSQNFKKRKIQYNNYFYNSDLNLNFNLNYIELINFKLRPIFNEYVEKFQEYLTFPRVENIKSALSGDEKITESMLYEDILVDYRTDEPTIEQSDVDQNYKKCYGMCKGFLYKNKLI